jgi:hypothetical protein
MYKATQAMMPGRQIAVDHMRRQRIFPSESKSCGPQPIRLSTQGPMMCPYQAKAHAEPRKTNPKTNAPKVSTLDIRSMNAVCRWAAASNLAMKRRIMV